MAKNLKGAMEIKSSAKLNCPTTDLCARVPANTFRKNPVPVISQSTTDLSPITSHIYL